MIATSMSPASAHLKPINTVDLADTATFSSNIMELDTNGDGKIGEAEFAVYRARKQARGEYIPSETQTTHASISDEVQRALFEILMERAR